MTTPQLHLVHGTRLTGLTRSRVYRPAWYQTVTGTLERSFGSRLATVEYLWSGRNSLRARREAAESLFNHLLSSKKSSGVVDVYLLSHSHGGSVAYECCARHSNALIEAGIQVRGLICLGTPFIVQRQRDESDNGPLLLLFSALFAPLALGAAVLDGTCDEPLSCLLRHSTASGVQFFAFYLKLLAMLLISSSGAALILGLLQKLKTQVKNRDVQIESTFNVPLYLVRTPGDEASGLLTFFAFANYVGKLLFQHASPFTVRVVGPDDSVAEGKSPTRFVGVRFPVLMILSATAIGGSLFWSEPTLRPDQLLLPTLVTLCFLGSIVACVALLVHCGYCRACGMTSPLDWMSSQVYVEHGPVGVRATFEVLAPDASVEGLRHSFQDREETQERIVQILEDWLGQRCSEREA